MQAGSIGKVAVIGGGLIGTSWAALFQAGGYEVRLWDPSESALAQAPAAVQRALAQVRELGLDRPGSFTTCRSLAEALKDADWVQENAPEKIEVKRDLLAQIEAHVTDGCVIASSTSSLVWSDLAAMMRQPQRLIVAHPFNPPHLIPLVELFGSDAGVLDRAQAFFVSVHRRPIRLKKEAPGHVANRLSSALYREAVHIVAEGIASVEDVDRALVEGPGLRWAVQGPHLSYHLGGGAGGITHYLTHLGPSQVNRWRSLGNPELTENTRSALIEGVMAEAAGRSIQQLEQERDTGLMRILRGRQSGSPSSPTTD